MIVQRLRQVGCAACVLFALTACWTGDQDEPLDDPSDPPALPTRSPEMPTPQQQSNDPDVLFTTTFDDDASQLFFVGETSFGASATISDGRYVVEVADGEWQTITPGPMRHPHNGVIEAEVALTGTGYGGLVARSSTDASGDYWMYVCLIDETGWAGCVASRGDTYHDLFFEEIDGYVPSAMQRMRLTVIEDRIELVINDQVIGSAQDTSIQVGAWGVFAESQSESLTTVVFDNLTISSVLPGVDPVVSPGNEDRQSAYVPRPRF